MSEPPPPHLDRRAIVRRHHPVLESANPRSPFGVALPQGGFVFTADVTGLQTLTDLHSRGQPLNTMAEWAWHENPNPERFTLADTTAPHPHADGTRPYSPAKPPPGISPAMAARWPAAAAWLRANPHRISLGNLGFHLPGQPARAITPADLSHIRQELDLWTGALTSRFTLLGKEVAVTTVATRAPDGIAVRIESDLLESGALGLVLAFPAADDGWGTTASFARPDSHQTEAGEVAGGHWRFRRVLDETRYAAGLRWTGAAELTKIADHRWVLAPKGSRVLEVRLSFHPDAGAAAEAVDFQSSVRSAAEAWRNFWQTGGMVDFSGSTDPRAGELERRVVLSRYLTAIHCAAGMPPQETGLAQNSWHGKFHLEMLPWHIAHFAMWGRPDIVDDTLAYYHRILALARTAAANQGCMGARWPKMTDPSGRESPSDVGVFLVWQQPHPIYLAELVRRASPGGGIMEKHREIVYATGDFLASFPRRGPDGRLHLVPPLIPAQECYPPAETRDPAYELAYFRWALGVARDWRKALGDPPDPGWDRAFADLAPLPVNEDRYATVSGPPFTKYHDHPCVAMILGGLPPTAGFDPARFSRTLDDLSAKWQWSTTWGWDPPVLALAAARLGRTADAVAELLRDTPKNTYLPNGHNYQDARLPLYLPGNGGLLHAVAAMTAGWDGAPGRPNPGFPDDGRWQIRSEGLAPVP